METDSLLFLEMNRVKKRTRRKKLKSFRKYHEKHLLHIDAYIHTHTHDCVRGDRHQGDLKNQFDDVCVLIGGEASKKAICSQLIHTIINEDRKKTSTEVQKKRLNPTHTDKNFPNFDDGDATTYGGRDLPRG